VDERPGASELRSKLSALQEEQRLGLIRAPDGTMLTSPEALVAWCERHWNEAAAWMCADLPERIGRRWNRPTLAQELRGIVQRHAHSQGAALDAALALLDPHGFGQMPLSLEARPKQLRFGVIPRRTNVSQTLTVRNSGRRHVMLRLVTPGWIIQTGALSARPLAPGEETQILLSAFVDSDAPELEQTVGCYQDHQAVLLVPVHCQLARELPKRSAIFKTAMALFVGAMVLFQLVAPQAPKRSSTSSRQTLIAQVLAPTPSLASRTSRPTAPASRSAVPTAPSSGRETLILPTIPPAQARSGTPPPPTFTPSEISWGYVLNADISRDGQLLAHVYSNTIEVLRAQDRQALWRHPTDSALIYWLGFSPDGDRIAATLSEGKINIWQASTGSLQLTISTASSPNYLTWSPDGSRLAERNFDGQVVVWDTATGKKLWVTQLPVFPSQVVWGPEGKTLSLAFVNRVEVLSGDSGKPLQQVSLEAESILGLVLSPDGRFAAIKTLHGLQVRSLPDNTLVRDFGPDYDVVNTFAFSSDGRLIAGAAYHKATFWSVETGTKASTSTALDLRSIRFSPDSQRLIGISQIDNNVELVDVIEPK
jgi:hypothetical protein